MVSESVEQILGTFDRLKAPNEATCALLGGHRSHQQQACCGAIIYE